MNMKREPITKGSIITVAVWLLTVAAAGGYFTGEEAAQIEGMIPQLAAVAAIIINFGLAAWQRNQVTPIDDPKNALGEALLSLEQIKAATAEDEPQTYTADIEPA